MLVQIKQYMDIDAAKKTLSELVKKYPKSEAAKGAKERLAKLG